MRGRKRWGGKGEETRREAEAQRKRKRKRKRKSLSRKWSAPKGARLLFPHLRVIRLFSSAG
jgi:hypothetical protein